MANGEASLKKCGMNINPKISKDASNEPGVSFNW